MSLAFALSRLSEGASVPIGLDWMVYHLIMYDFKSAGEILASRETGRTHNMRGAPLSPRHVSSISWVHLLRPRFCPLSKLRLSAVDTLKLLCESYVQRSCQKFQQAFARVTQNVETCSGASKLCFGRLYE